MQPSPPATPSAPPPPSDSGPTAQPAPATATPTSANANPPRLVIDRLTLQNFKSYGGVVHVGPFHTSFSSIVGPNGSGKSNVIDAMLFVFGRRAKALRHNKLSELLHHSTAYPSVDSASVTVYFSEIVDGATDGEFQPVEGSQFAVCRRAFRNNTSKYYIDGKEVKMAQVVSLLKGKGVDLDNNRFLILQGEVEQIAMMKPKGVAVGDDGLLEYLEDIIGSGRFVERIESSGKRVEELNEERGHKLNRVKAAERERNGLESAKIEAEDYLDKERIVLGKKLALCRAALAERLQRLSLNGKEMKEKEAEFDEFKKEMKGKDHELKDLESVFKETQKNADIAVKTMNKAKDEYTAFERKDIKLREDMKAFRARLKKLDSVKNSEENRAGESKERVQAFEKEKEKATARVKELQTELQALEQELDKVRDHAREKTAGVRRELEAKQTEKLPFSEKVNEARKQLDVTQSELKLVMEKLEAPKIALREAEEGLAKMEENSENAKDSVLQLQAEERELNDRINVLKREQAEGRALHPKLSTAASNLRRRLEEAKAAKEDVHTRSRLHNGILSASRNGVLHGVVGRLGDLASVDARFAAAVGAAAGANLDCIVVKTAENAQACIQFLRRENLGRATFVILEKIEYLRKGVDEWERSGRSADGPRLFDHLRIPKPEHRTALYYALRDTLVADSLESARRMAFKPTRQNRVVSLAGELIESSGAMSGGGRGPSKYRLGSGSGGDAPLDPAELQQLEEKYEGTKRQAGEVQVQLQEIDDKIRRCYSRLDEVQVLIGKANMESESFTSRIAYMRQQTLPALIKAVTDADKRVKNKGCEDTKQRNQLEQKVSVGERKLREAQKACETLESDINTLQERIVEMGGSKLQEATDAVANCRAEISESQSVASRASSRATAAMKAGKKAEGAVKAAEEEIEATTTKIEEAKEMSETMLNDAEKVLEKFKETEEVHKEWEEKLGEVQKEYREVKGRLKELRRKELSLFEAVQNVRALVTRDRMEVGNLKKQEKRFIGKMKETSLASVATVVKETEETEEEGGNSMEIVEEEDAENDDEVDAMEEEEGGEAADADAKEEDSDGTDYEEYKLSAQEHKQLTMEVGVLESELSKLTPNLSAIAEYKRKDEEYRGQVNELDALTQMRDTARRECDGLRKARLDEFMSGFSVITLKLKELYQMITLGGDAELELVDSLDPFSEGIVFSVRPPKKSWKNISNLSGGEKTLSSLALVFALHHFKPTPLYFLDEIDAALDYKNVSIVANYVKERTKNAQFIIISLRNNMFELADRLVGIYKTYNVTKSVSIDPGAFVMPPPASEQEDVAA